MFGFDSHHDEVYNNPSANKASWSHELIAGAAAYEVMKKHEAGTDSSHKFSKEVFAAMAGAEADKLIETKGLNFVDREKAQTQARQNAERIYDARYA
ncbi:hypothetical protein EMPS_06737 [Entomortierella parvispora]|uniref:CipC-like antibiotic response protein n=1 Tax=Entomortierella parvispora TaxID=205924 RepID=A0A9P3LXP8_9FUNG|nr:hypothetical protein EMPS_06737 [Entomortierella parvispora]